MATTEMVQSWLFSTERKTIKFFKNENKKNKGKKGKEERWVVGEVILMDLLRTRKATPKICDVSFNIQIN